MSRMPKSYSVAPGTGDHEIVTRLPLITSPGDEEDPGEALRGTLGREKDDSEGEDRVLACVCELLSVKFRRSFIRQRDRSRPVRLSHLSFERAESVSQAPNTIRAPNVNKNACFMLCVLISPLGGSHLRLLHLINRRRGDQFPLHTCTAPAHQTHRNH